MADLVTFTADQARRLLAMLRRSEADGRSGAGESQPRRPADPVQVLKITGAAVSGEDPAKVRWWNASVGAETLSDEVRFRPADGSALASGQYALGRFSGPSSSGAYGLYVGTPLPAGYSGTQTVVTDVSWNTSTCTMTKTTKSFVWANGILQSAT